RTTDCDYATHATIKKRNDHEDQHGVCHREEAPGSFDCGDARIRKRPGDVALDETHPSDSHAITSIRRCTRDAATQTRFGGHAMSDNHPI
ncbi:unnamed protein product, partial [Prorocentrum cordatum]